MAAMNKQQALNEQRRRNRAAQEFEASGGKIRQQSNGVEYYIDENGQRHAAGIVGNGDNAINDYIDAILGTSGVTNAGTQVQDAGPGPSGGGKGSGNGKDAGTAEEGDTSGSESDEKVVQDSLDAGIPLELIAGGLLGAGAALIGQRIMKARKGATAAPNAASSAAAAAPNAPPDPSTAVATFGDGTVNQDFIDATFDDVLGIEGPRNALPPPTANSDGSMPDAVMTQGAPAPTPVDDPNLYRTGESPRTDVGQGYPTPDPVAETIQEVDGGSNAKLVDPLEEGLANRIAQILAKQGNYNPPVVSPATKGVNMAIMQRVRAILAGMRP